LPLALIASLDGARVETAWDAEIERRIEQVDRGAELLDWYAVKAEVGEALKRR